MRESNGISKIEERLPDMIRLLNGILEGTDQIRAGKLDGDQQRHIMDIRNKGESLLAILGVDSVNEKSENSPDVPPETPQGQEQDLVKAPDNGTVIPDDKDRYVKSMHRFCEHFDEWRKTILLDMETGYWKEYAIRFETFVRIFDSLNNEGLSEWSDRLLAACRKGDFDACLRETVSACNAMEAFRDKLLVSEASQYNAGMRQIKDENKEFLLDSKEFKAVKIKTDVPFLIDKLKELKEACAGFKANKINEIIPYIKGISINENVEASMSVILQQLGALDYDKAAVRIGMLLSVLMAYKLD
jgi:hypothetical protein